MSVAIRYQSRGGHVKEMAEIIAEGVGVDPISIDDPRAPITKPVDVLFIGGALYKFRLDPGLEEFIESIPEGMVRTAIVFGSSALTRRPVYLIQERVKARGIDIHPSALYMRGKPKPYLHEIGSPWAAREAANIEKKIKDGTYGLPEEAPIVQMMKAKEERKAKNAAAAEAKIAKEAVAELEAAEAELGAEETASKAGESKE